MHQALCFAQMQAHTLDTVQRFYNIKFSETLKWQISTECTRAGCALQSGMKHGVTYIDSKCADLLDELVCCPSDYPHHLT